MVKLEAYFSVGPPPQGAKVIVFPDGDREKPLLEIYTDEKGECSFPRPAPGKYIIVVDAGAGHRKELPLEVRVRPELIPGITLVVGSASLGGIGNLGLFPIIAQEADTVDRSKGPTREEFTTYHWSSIFLGIGIIGVVGLAFWIVRRAAGT
jgi:preprotein translocase subunit Sss1